MTPVLETERLLLRPACVEDAEALHAHYSDPDAMLYWSHGPHAELAETQAKLAGILAAPNWRLWAITLAGDHRAIGTVAVGERRQKGVIEIGYALLRAHGRQGYAHEALSALFDQLFGVEGLRRVVADIDPANAASRRLVERLGFRLEGVLRSEWETHMGVRDSCLYGLLADEWLSSSASNHASGADSTAGPAPDRSPA